LDREIGVVVDGQGDITEFYNMKKINIYHKMEEWKLIRTVEISVSVNSLMDLRQNVMEVIGKLDNCRVLIAQSITGIPYHLLDKSGFVICEAKLFNIQLLDMVYEELTLEKVEEKIEVASIPQPTDQDGNFFFDLVKLQKYRPDISSKKALIPFLSNELFQSVTIHCSHMMPWLDSFTKERNLELSYKEDDGRGIVVITHRVCGE